MTRGTLRPWGQGVAGRAMALPASRARHLVSRRGAFRISAESLRGEQVADLAVAEAFSGPVVEFGGDLVQLGFAVHGQIAALREVLAQQATDRPSRSIATTTTVSPARA